ncbi:MAG: hypothetical protein EZS28_021094 [Streblomastix strix]|uniref:Inositol polyphosphate-related phosphatase domain-containing protein n=1 Tax=Streblomastix strix TaxID=222440 RepID=A0A5J4VLC1_9EUKA|nr:MAG: hypothetical protein EZS28_021094 [Streblomastix strix]
MDTDQLFLFCGTLNAGTKGPEDPLRDWLRLDKGYFHIYAISTQEIVPLKFGQLVKDDTSNQRRWEQALQLELGDSYELV